MHQTDLTSYLDFLESCWNCTQRAGLILSHPKMKVCRRGQDIICGSDGEAQHVSLHAPHLIPCDFPSLNHIPPHPATLLGLKYGSGTPDSFLMAHLLNHQKPVFGWSGILQGSFHLLPDQSLLCLVGHGPRCPCARGQILHPILPKLKLTQCNLSVAPYYFSPTSKQNKQNTLMQHSTY